MVSTMSNVVGTHVEILLLNMALFRRLRLRTLASRSSETAVRQDERLKNKKYSVTKMTVSGPTIVPPAHEPPTEVYVLLHD